jgi:hypothetical protein
MLLAYTVTHIHGDSLQNLLHHPSAGLYNLVNDNVASLHTLHHAHDASIQNLLHHHTAKLRTINPTHCLYSSVNRK